MRDMEENFLLPLVRTRCARERGSERRNGGVKGRGEKSHPSLFYKYMVIDGRKVL